MSKIPYELIDMILLDFSDCQIAIQLCRTYIAKKLVIHKHITIEEEILNDNLQFIKFLHNINHSKFRYCQIKQVTNKEYIHYLHSIAEISSNIDECHYYKNRLENNPSLVEYKSRPCNKCINVLIIPLSFWYNRDIRDMYIIQM
jgi:Ni,Fe-hydrogenase III component G